MQAVAQANLRQPRYTTHARTNVRGDEEVEPLRRWRRLVWTGKQQSHRTRPLLRGSGDGMHGKVRGLNWGTARGLEAGGTKKISHLAAISGSDEAIVSEDLIGQNNQSASQGPLDGMVLVIGSAKHAPLGP